MEIGSRGSSMRAVSQYFFMGIFAFLFITKSNAPETVQWAIDSFMLFGALYAIAVFCEWVHKKITGESK